MSSWKLSRPQRIQGPFQLITNGGPKSGLITGVSFGQWTIFLLPRVGLPLWFSPVNQNMVGSREQVPCKMVYGHAKMTAYPLMNETRRGIILKHLQKIQTKLHKVSLVTQPQRTVNPRFTVCIQDHF